MFEISKLNFRTGKKGVIKNETLSLILAVVVLVLFIFAVVKFYGAYIKKQELKQANNILDLVYSKAESNEPGWRGFSLQGIKSDDGWSLIAWNANEPGKPERCLFDACICVCNFNNKKFKVLPIPGASIASVDKSEVTSICQDALTGTCKQLKFNGKVDVGSTFQLNSLDILVGNDGLFTANVPYIPLPAKLSFIKIIKNKNVLIFASWNDGKT